MTKADLHEISVRVYDCLDTYDANDNGASLDRIQDYLKKDPATVFRFLLDRIDELTA